MIVLSTYLHPANINVSVRLWKSNIRKCWFILWKAFRRVSVVCFLAVLLHQRRLGTFASKLNVQHHCSFSDLSILKWLFSSCSPYPVFSVSGVHLECVISSKVEVWTTSIFLCKAFLPYLLLTPWWFCWCLFFSFIFFH